VDEWKECRNTIGRMDTILEDLRKYGFSLVTALLTASGIVGAVANNRPVLPLASVVVMVLVIALFGIDLSYQVVLNGAAERALDLEFVSLPPRIRITKTVSDYVVDTHAATATFALYVALLGTAFGMGLFGSDAVVPRWWVVAVAVVLLGTMTCAWLFVRNRTKLNKKKYRGTWPPA